MTTNELVAFLDGVHEQVVEFAKRSYSEEGRGLVRISIPDLKIHHSGSTFVVTDMVFHTLQQLHELFNDVSDEQRTDANQTLEMVETYDP